jgi:HTH-type transcriptional regulator / antitoxin HipB
VCLERYAVDQIARTPKQIGDAIRRQRRKLGLNQTSIGDKTKLRQATISAVESGAPGTQLGTLCDILAALDLEFVIRPRTKAKPAEIEDIF